MQMVVVEEVGDISVDLEERDSGEMREVQQHRTVIHDLWQGDLQLLRKGRICRALEQLACQLDQKAPMACLAEAARTAHKMVA